MSDSYYSNHEIALDATSRVQQVYWRLVLVFVILVAISFIPSFFAAVPKRVINNEKCKALAEYDVSFAEETNMQTMVDIPTFDEFVEIERNTKSGKTPEFFIDNLPGISSTDFTSHRKQITAPYSQKSALVDLISNIASFLLFVFVIGPVNAGYARTILDYKDDGISYTPSDLTPQEMKEANTASFVSGTKDIFSFALKEKRYPGFVRSYFLFFGLTHIGSLLRNVQTISGLTVLAFPVLALTLVGLWFAVFEFTFIDYILADDPEISTAEAFKLSRKLMRGNKGRLWGIMFSFPLWILIVIVSCGLGFVFFAPIYRFAIGSFYEYLRYGRRTAEPDVEENAL